MITSKKQRRLDLKGQKSTRNMVQHRCDEPNCNKSFARPSKLQAHKLVHTNNKPFICSIDGCVKAYYRHQHLKRHQQRGHAKSQIPVTSTFPCDETGCKMSFSSKQSLEKHISRKHGEEKHYNCPVEGCNMSFKKKHLLRSHSFDHKGVLPFQCHFPGCNSKFKQSSHLARHRKMHDGYKCPKDGCDIILEKWSLLRKHISKCHQKVYKCPVCMKTFLRKAYLKDHETSHVENSEMIQCPEEGCQRKYALLRNLNAHIKSFHRGQSFSCTQSDCSKTFSSKQKLMEHLKNHGKMKPKVARKKTKPASVHLLRAVCGAAAETALMQEMKKAGADARLVVSTSVFNNARCFDDKWEAKQQVTCENDVASVDGSEEKQQVVSENHVVSEDGSEAKQQVVSESHVISVDESLAKQQITSENHVISVDESEVRKPCDSVQNNAKPGTDANTESDVKMDHADKAETGKHGDVKTLRVVSERLPEELDSCIRKQSELLVNDNAGTE